MCYLQLKYFFKYFNNSKIGLLSPYIYYIQVYPLYSTLPVKQRTRQYLPRLYQCLWIGLFMAQIGVQQKGAIAPNMPRGVIIRNHIQHKAQQDSCRNSHNRTSREIARWEQQHRESQRKHPNKEMERTSNSSKHKHFARTNN